MKIFYCFSYASKTSCCCSIIPGPNLAFVLYMPLFHPWAINNTWFGIIPFQNRRSSFAPIFLLYYTQIFNFLPEAQNFRTTQNTSSLNFSSAVRGFSLPGSNIPYFFFYGLHLDCGARKPVSQIPLPIPRTQAFS